MGYGPISSIPLGALPYFSGSIVGESEIQVQEAITAIYAATHFFITYETDEPPDTAFSGTLEPTLRIDSSIADSSEGYGGFTNSISELSLINSDGEYDEFAGAISVNGQRVRIAIGQIDNTGTLVDPYSEFETAARLVAERFVISRTRMTIEMRDPALAVITAPVQQNIYEGTGGVDGIIELTGKRKPFLDGKVFNVTPVQVIPAELLYQLNDGEIASIESVKDGGAALTFYGDYATVSQLRNDAINIPPSYYGTSLADGYFALGGTPFKQVTADATGVNTTTADIIASVAADITGGPELDTGSFDHLNLQQPATVGYYLDSDSSETCADMFTKLMTGIGGWWGMTPLGLLRVERFEEPDSFLSLASYDTDGGDLLDIDRTKLPSGLDPPPQRFRVKYQRNWTVMTELTGSMIEFYPVLADALRGPHQLAMTSDTDAEAVLQNYPDAPDPEPVESYFANPTDAQDEAERLFDLYTAGRSAYQFSLKNQLFVHQIGDVVQVTSDRLGLDGGKYLRIVSLSDDCSSMRTEVVGYG
jgi:hypothetical protein